MRIGQGASHVFKVGCVDATDGCFSLCPYLFLVPSFDVLCISVSVEFYLLLLATLQR